MKAVCSLYVRNCSGLCILSIKLFNIDVLISELNLAKFEFRLRSKNDYIQLNLEEYRWTYLG